MSIKRRQWVMFALIIMTVAGGVAAEQPSRDRDRRGRRDRHRSGGSLKTGQEAPPFTLKSIDGKQETNLASFRGKRPVILFFGSYT